MASVINPNETIYLHNLNDKVKKSELKECLYALFSQHGRILEIVALKTEKMRGQAFIVFQEISEATKAMRALQGFPFFGKPMLIEYAKSRSIIHRQIEGYSRTTDLQSMGMGMGMGMSTSQTLKEPTASDSPESFVDPMMEPSHMQSILNKEEDQPISRVLIAHHLPLDITEGILTLLFHQYTGYVEAKLTQDKSDDNSSHTKTSQQEKSALIYFHNETAATVAKNALQGYKISTTQPLYLSYAPASN